MTPAQKFRDQVAQNLLDLGALEALLDAAKVPDDLRDYEAATGKVRARIVLSGKEFRIWVYENRQTEPGFHIVERTGRDIFCDARYPLSSAAEYIRSKS